VIDKERSHNWGRCNGFIADNDMKPSATIDEKSGDRVIRLPINVKRGVQ